MDRMMLERLRNGMNEKDYKKKFREFMSKRNNHNGMPQEDIIYKRRDFFNRDNSSYIDNMSEEDMEYFEMDDYRRDSMGNEAHGIVSSMYHMENGRRISGEKFNMHKAKKVKEEYSDLLHDVSVQDVYIAINAQYHDYAPLFKSWFREGIEHKIIESAIVFWFCDIDYKGASKVEDYFDM